MKSITSKAQTLVLGMKKNIKDHYQNDYILLKLMHDKRFKDEIEEYYYYLTYKDYEDHYQQLAIGCYINLINKNT